MIYLFERGQSTVCVVHFCAFLRVAPQVCCWAPAARRDRGGRHDGGWSGSGVSAVLLPRSRGQWICGIYSMRCYWTKYAYKTRLILCTVVAMTSLIGIFFPCEHRLSALLECPKQLYGVWLTVTKRSQCLYALWYFIIRMCLFSEKLSQYSVAFLIPRKQKQIVRLSKASSFNGYSFQEKTCQNWLSFLC